MAVEQQGVFRIDTAAREFAEPRRIITAGDGGFVGDAEGLALVRKNHRQTYLIVSDQGASRFRVYWRERDYALVGTFSVLGAQRTDGIAFAPGRFGPSFPEGLFACHTDADGGRTILVSDASPIWKLMESP